MILVWQVIHVFCFHIINYFENDISPTKPRSTQRQRHTSNAPIERFEDHYRVNFFLPFIDHTISHLNSRFTQGRKAIFYGNYLVSALVNNVNSEIVNDMKTEYMNDLPYQNQQYHYDGRESPPTHTGYIQCL
jgi:hypothetical protein